MRPSPRPALPRVACREQAPEVQRCPLKAHRYDNKDDKSLSYTTAAVSAALRVVNAPRGYPRRQPREGSAPGSIKGAVEEDVRTDL